MTELSIDEQTVLLIAAEGERLIPIGRWKEPIDSLFAKGLLVRERHPGDPTGHFNNVISPQGRIRADAMETGYDKVLAEAVSPQVMAPLVIADQKRLETRLRATAESLAAQMVELAREAAEFSGEGLQENLSDLADAIVARAKEMVK